MKSNNNLKKTEEEFTNTNSILKKKEENFLNANSILIKFKKELINIYKSKSDNEKKINKLKKEVVLLKRLNEKIKSPEYLNK